MEMDPTGVLLTEMVCVDRQGSCLSSVILLDPSKWSCWSVLFGFLSCNTREWDATFSVEISLSKGQGFNLWTPRNTHSAL